LSSDSGECRKTKRRHDVKRKFDACGRQLKFDNFEVMKNEVFKEKKKVSNKYFLSVLIIP
jgi:hypothetical protein